MTLVTRRLQSESLNSSPYKRSAHAATLIVLTTMSDEGELSEQEKQEIFQDLLSGSEYVLITFCRNNSMDLFLFRSGPLLPYIAKARWICASIHPFLDLSRVFYAGLPEALRNEDDEVDDIE